MTHGHGDDLYRYQGLIKTNFSTNIWQYADLAPLKRFLATQLDFVDSYPEPAPESLESDIASRLELPADGVMVTAGATDAIYSLARAYSGKGLHAIVQPTFSEYRDACLLSGCRISDAMSAAEAAQKGKVVWLCNPNNPTGSVIPAEELDYLAKTHPDKLFIIDQAYASYTTQTPLGSRAALEAGNIVLLHSLTKQCCVPGLRIGYITASPNLLAPLREARQPWTVNALSIAASRFLLDNPVSIPLPMLLTESKRMQEALPRIGIATLRSATNFILCRLPGGSVAAMKEWLAREKGMLIRDASNFRTLTPSHFRIAVQRPEENTILLKQIETWLSQSGLRN